MTKIESNENCANSRSKIEKLKLSISEKQKELQHISKLVREVTKKERFLENCHLMSQENHFFDTKFKSMTKIPKKTKTETEVLTKTIKGAIKIDAELTKKISNKGINYEKVLKQYQVLINRIQSVCYAIFLGTLADNFKNTREAK